MNFSKLTNVLETLDKTSSRLEMTAIISEFLKQTNPTEISTIVLFLRGRVFPLYDSREIGIADKVMIKSLTEVSGKTEKQVTEILRKKGDLGLVAQEILISKPQTTLFSQTLTLEKVRENLEKLSTLGGKGSQDKKLGYIKELLSNSEPADARFIVSLILGQLRLGVGDGVIRDAIAKSWNVEPQLVETSYNLRCNLGEVAEIAMNKGKEGLMQITMKPGRPVRVMLAQKASSINEVLEKFNEIQVETKYDGARVQIHKQDEKIQLFTRRLEDVTKQFPEITKLAAENIKIRNCIIEGEIVAIEKENRKPLPFQFLSRRIKRKYNIQEIMEKIPVEVNLFDIIYLNDQMKTDTPLNERRKILENSINTTPLFRLSDILITSSQQEIETFYQKSLNQGHEGVMLKVIDSPYKAGSRVGYMYKIKPVMETLDLVISGATWGEGRRAKWLGSFLLSVFDPETGDFLEIGRMATGVSDEQLDEMTKKLEPKITTTDGKEAKLKPEVVVEVAYEEIQKSPTYTSGYALRFPRLVRIREDKSIQDADTLNRVEEIIQM